MIPWETSNASRKSQKGSKNEGGNVVEKAEWKRREGNEKKKTEKEGREEGE